MAADTKPAPTKPTTTRPAPQPAARVVSPTAQPAARVVQPAAPKPSPVPSPTSAQTAASQTQARPATGVSKAVARELNPTVLPEALKAVMELDPKDRAAAVKQSVNIKPEVPLSLAGDWKSAPDAPGLVGTYSFTVPDGVTALDADLKPVTGSLVGKTRLYKFTVPFTTPTGSQSISVVTNKGVVVPLHVTTKLQSELPVVVMDPGCGSFGLSAEIELPDHGPAKDAGHTPIVAFVRCAREGSGIAIKAWTWNELRWDTPQLGTSGRWQPTPNKPAISGVLPLFPESGGSAQMRLPLSHATNRKQVVATVSINQADLRTPTWQISATLGPTWSTYKETATGLNDVKVSQVGLTAKVQTQFRIHPPRWDLAASVFGTVAPLSVDAKSTTTTPARWLGINLRGGYALPLDHANRNMLVFLPGIYAWSMFVSGNQYGVQNLNGPQLVVAYSHEQGWRVGKAFTFQRFGGYVKFATVTPGFAFPDLSNHELAAGGSMTFRFSFIPRPLVVAADYSDLTFADKGFGLNLTTFSVSLGVSLF